MSYLLDTRVLLWLLSDETRVPVAIRKQLADREHRLLVSPASGIEIATKIRIGKLDDTDHLVTPLVERVHRMGATTLPITMEHALLAGSMPWSNRDPFDRILVAQATIEGATLVTVDRAMAQLPAPSILTW